MKQEDLIKKWLDNDLNSQEFEAFKQLKDFKELTRLDISLQQFKPLEFESENELKKLNLALKSKTKNQKNWIKPLLRVAAIIAICFGSYYYTTTLDSNFNTEFAQKENVLLPDHSQVKLNAKSSLVFNTKNWANSRDIDLTGEAYFKVAKGSKFTVHTLDGEISVLGTEFNVKNRNNLFEVVCYEGSVKVNYNNTSRVLKPGERFLVINNSVIENAISENTQPFWVNNESVFKSIPYTLVLEEFERQYNVTFNLKTIDTSKLFSGSFTHNNIDVALQSITIPLNLAYTKNNNKISLKRE